ncbi:MAG: RNA polymerase sigma factor WhiG [Treponema sp.]|jgi:RNA polymerase sigma factor for flagellar operon FliA|nr:RNA polymerase sigma factor WhiG [Treponema sp.]
MTVTLEQKEENELWREYRKTKDWGIRERLVTQYAPLVKYVAGKVAIVMPHNIEFDDLVGFGQFGLLDAIDKFDPNKGVKFKTYAVLRIRGAIIDELRSIDWVPRSVRQKAREIENAIGTIEAQLGRIATDREVADSLGMTEEEYGKNLMKISCTTMLSLNDVWFSGDENDKVSIGESLEAAMNFNPDVMMEITEIKRVVNESLKELPEKEKRIIVLYYYEDLTLKEIGRILGVTESRVSQLHTKAIIHLRSKLTHARRGIV